MASFIFLYLSFNSNNRRNWRRWSMQSLLCGSFEETLSLRVICSPETDWTGHITRAPEPQGEHPGVKATRNGNWIKWVKSRAVKSCMPHRTVGACCSFERQPCISFLSVCVTFIGIADTSSLLFLFLYSAWSTVHYDCLKEWLDFLYDLFFMSSWALQDRACS